ncbi:MAG: NAD(P)H-dependent flavin oxidoreductase [Syntrophomonadales bacterium]|jgi:NAD(P)H-dependent flavin oxidoreductase YrpB (nitropropane dioxygenase family)
MIKSRLCDLVGIKYPIIQAGMGPFPTTDLCIASANAGVLGILSSSGLANQSQKQIYGAFCRSGNADPDKDSPEEILRKIFYKVLENTRESQGIFGVNVMVSAEMKDIAQVIIGTMLKVREEDPEMKKRFKVLITSAGDPLPWSEVIKKTDLVWMHVMPSVQAARRCKKAGVNVIIASGHEGGFHTSWEPVHSMILLPAVIDEVADENTLIVGTGGFCDGKTLAAALVMGAEGAQMGTRFLATEESDFPPLWKQGVVETPDRGTLVARGFVGPARWIKNDRSKLHQRNTLQKSPGVFLGVPDDYSTMDMSLIDFENESINAVYAGDREKAMMAAGESAQRCNDLPKVNDLVQTIMKETEEILRAVPNRLA